MDFQDIKARIRIEDAIPFLGLNLKRTTNGQLRGKCPACDSDNERALVVTPSKGAYCFNEKRGGDLLWLVSHVKGIGVRQAAQELAAHFLTEPQEPRRSKQSGTGAAKESQQATGNVTLMPLSYLDHSQAFGLDEETAKALGIGFAAKGLMRSRIAIPIRTDTGKLVGYVGIEPDADVKLPTKFHL